MAELAIRLAEEEDTDRILDLVRLSLGVGSIPRERAFWDWKHRLNPFGESPMLIAEAGGEIVGLRVFMRWEWCRAGATVRAVRAVDTATHPDWQGKGIFSRLTKSLLERMLQEGVHFVFNTPNDKSRPGYLKMGWRAVGRTDLWIRPVHPLRALRAIRSGSARAGGTGELEGRGHSVEELCNHPALESFLAAAEPSGEHFRTNRSRDYLRWRYALPPGFDYRCMFDLNGSEGAVVVYRSKAQGRLGELRICELIVGRSSRSRKMARTLLRQLRRTASEDYISAMSGSVAPGRVLLPTAFLPAMRLGPIVTVRPLAPLPGRAPLEKRNQWQLSIGDLELF